MQPQPGIFSLGSPEHCFIEFDLHPGAGAGSGAGLVTALAALAGPGTSVGGLSAVVGFRPQLWAEVAPEAARPDVSPFEAIVGPDFEMPANSVAIRPFPVDFATTKVFHYKERAPSGGRPPLATAGPVRPRPGRAR
jgi:hypothetical protein